MIGVTYGEPEMSKAIDCRMLNVPILNPDTMTALEVWRVKHADTEAEVVFEVARPRTLFGIPICNDPFPAAKAAAESEVYELARSIWEQAKLA